MGLGGTFQIQTTAINYQGSLELAEGITDNELAITDNRKCGGYSYSWGIRKKN
jgi:hypothetical protein